MNPIRYSFSPHPSGLSARFLILTVSVLLLHVLFLGIASASEGVKDEQQRGMRKMLSTITAYGMTDPTVLEAMAQVPRHLFVPAKFRKYSYEDSPLGIGYGQTISQPFIVAEMTRLLHLTAETKVLEIGTGSGYQAAVLAEITNHVYTIEIVKPLFEQAGRTLAAAGYTNVRLRHGDGYYGWPEEAPFSAIIVTAAAGHIPPPLLEQLAVGGRMVIPVGKRFGTQYLILVTKDRDGKISSRNLMPVRFVPLVRQ